jgi:hypothetical protein
MMTDIIDNLLQVGELHARKILLELKQKELTPFYHLAGGEGEKDAIIPCSFTNDFQKQLTFLAAQSIAKQIKAVAGMFVAESWVLCVKADTYQVFDQMPRPSQHPDRIEVVMMVATTGRETRSRSLRIIRAGNKETGRITDLVNQGLPGEMSEIGGRMIDGLIEPAKLDS